jgi:hypothetical protein
MSTEMDHTYVQELLPQYAAQTLNETVRQQVEAHLKGCASCQSALGEWRLIIDTLHDELAALPTDTEQEQSWSTLRARLIPQQRIHEPKRNSTRANTGPVLNQPRKSPPAVVTRGPAYQRWLGFVSVIAAAFIILASLALFGTLRRNNPTSTVVAPSPTVSAATASATDTTGCVNARPSGDTLTRYTALLDMSFISPVDGWATGLQYNATQPAPFSGVIYHLQNCHWQRFPLSLPKIGLSTISMVSADEGWAFTIKLSGARGH